MSGAADTAPRVKAHPRIRERRIAVQREAGRRRLRLLVAAVAVVAVVAGGVAALQSPLTDVDRVRVAGARMTTRAEVLRVAGLDRRRQLLDVDPARIAARVERLPWVGTATVRRSWPSTVAIAVTERRPVLVAPVGAGERWALLDATGRVLALEPTRRPGFPALSRGPEPGRPGTTIDGRALVALRVAAALPADLGVEVGDVVMADDGGVDLALLPSGVVRFGDAADLPAQLEALVTVLGAVERESVAVIDVRVPSAPTITRRPQRETLTAG